MRTETHLSPVIDAMAKAGQELAIQWGHPAWSDSWARCVAAALLQAQMAATNQKQASE